MSTAIDGSDGSDGSTTDPPQDGGGLQQASSSSSTTTSQQATATTNAISSNSISATASPATTTSQSSAPSGNGSTSYSAADLAGGIVGAALGAALLTFLLTFLFFRKRRGRRPSSFALRRNHEAGQVTYIEEKSSAKQDRSDAPWQAYLPQPADDQSIRHDLKSLFDQVELHVENFYRKASVRTDGSLASALAQVDAGHLPRPIQEMIESQRLQRHVLKHVIASALIKAMLPASDPRRSLLPAHLRMVPTKLDAASLRSQEAPVARQAFSEWKRLSIYLCPQPEEEPAFVEERARVINRNSDALDKALSPWRTHGDENTFRQHERALFTQASHLAVKLVSQSWDFKFVWNEHANGGDDAIVTYPGLLKTTDEHGRLLQTPHMLVSPATVRV